MIYADSAIDYTWEVLSLNVSQRLMQVKYSTADSARPDVVLNLEPRYDQFNDSDLRFVAEDAAITAVIEWDKVVEAVNANPSFNADSYVGTSASSRYKVRIYDDAPVINEYIQYYSSYDSEGPDDICTKYNIHDLPDSTKGYRRATIRISNDLLWHGLLEEGRLDSAIDTIGITGVDFDQYDSDNISMVIGSTLDVFDSYGQASGIGSTIKTLLGYSNDSDWASWLLENGARGNYSPFGA